MGAHCWAGSEVLRAKEQHDKFADFAQICKSEQLVDIYLALATLCDFKMALFIVGSYKTAGVMSRAESMLINKHQATNMKQGRRTMPCSYHKTSGPCLSSSK